MTRSGFIMAIVALLALPAVAADLPRFRWENFTTENGLPNNRVY